MQFDSENVFAAISAGRHENNIACRGNYLLYSRSRCPILHHLNSRSNSALLGHTDEVNGLSLVVEPDGDLRFIHVISSSYDKTAIIWRADTGPNHADDRPKYDILHRIQCPTEEPFSARATMKRNGSFISVTSTLSNVIYIWANDQLVHTLQEGFYTLHCHITNVSSRDTAFDFIFLSGDDNKIRAYQIESNNRTRHLLDLTGHKDWIKCLDTLNLKSRDGEFLLASASQDAYIRVWHMRVLTDNSVKTHQERVVSSIQLESDQPMILSATLETVLLGHENIVHGLCWFKNLPDLQLVSCSADKNLIIWNSKLAEHKPSDNQDQTSECNHFSPASADKWMEVVKFGETGETNLPFLGVCLTDDEKTIYAYSLHGAIHSWNLRETGWRTGYSITGHFEPVTDLSWEMSRGAYLLSSSLDRTCRLFALATGRRWHEIGRPQVHGYEINCIASIAPSRFASGSEEKIVRVYESTQFFMRSLMNARLLSESASYFQTQSDLLADLPPHAQLPALGLSNKAAQSPYDLEEPTDEKNTGQSNTWYSVSNLVKELAKIECLESPPTEEILLQSTLWWEANKLFGHSNEIYSIAKSYSGNYMASASKANRPDLAKIFIWDCSKLRKLGEIGHHSLTITRLRFSWDSQYLLSVSRDRTWALCQRGGQGRNPYKLMMGTNKSNSVHERIIWDCCWTWDSKYFITVSRDKKAAVWSVDELSQSDEPAESDGGDRKDIQSISGAVGNNVIERSLKVVRSFSASVQAVDSPNYKLSKLNAQTSYLVAFGLESGCVELHTLETREMKFTLVVSLENLHQGLSIKRLAFRPFADKRAEKEKEEEEEEDAAIEQLLLASAGDDCVVRLTNIKCFERSR